MTELTILSGIGAVGYGIPEASVEAAQDEHDIDAITADGGSIDGGPNYLGQSKPNSSWENIKRDLRLLLTTRDEEDVPLMIGSCGTSGSDEALDKTVELAKEIANEENLEFELAKIYANVDRDRFKEGIDNDDIVNIDYEKELTGDDVDRSETIVGMTGLEPYVEAIEAGADVILGGRSVDVAPMAAFPIAMGYDKGLALHMGKILECGAFAATPSSGSDSIVGVIGEDYFEVIPPNPDRKCTENSVAAHTLYEKIDPFTIKLPGYEVDLSNADYEQVDERRVRVTGTEYEETEYAVLLEGVEKAGYRYIAPGGVRGPEIEAKLHDIFEATREDIERMVDVSKEQYTLTFRTYGDGMGVHLNKPDQPIANEAHELGFIIDVVGETEEVAQDVCSFVKTEMLHRDFEGRFATAGNLAFPYSPSLVDVGVAYKFSVHHLLTNVEPGELSETEIETVGPAKVEGVK